MVFTRASASLYCLCFAGDPLPQAGRVRKTRSGVSRWRHRKMSAPQRETAASSQGICCVARYE